MLSELRALLALLVQVLPACVLVMSARAVHAEFNTRTEAVGKEVKVRIHDGYPRANDSFSSPTTVGIDLINAGSARSVEVTFEGDAQLTRRVQLPAREQASFFMYLPQRGWRGLQYASVRITDRMSGATESFSVESNWDGRNLNRYSVARLGTVSAAFNVDAPWQLAGALDDHLPDDWRGISGLHAIVVEESQLARWRASWPVLKDWVVAGGLLIISTTAQELATPSMFDAGTVPMELAGVPLETEAGILQPVGLGQIARVLPTLLALLDGDFRRKLGLEELAPEEMAAFQSLELVERSASSRLASAVHTQVGLLFLLLACFALLVGPLGYVYFVRRRARPLRYVSFVAGLALCFSLAVIVADVFANGVHAKAAVHSAILIDQRVDRELGFEDAALFDPTGFGVTLQPLAAAQWLLPWQSTESHSLPVVLESAGERLRIQNAVPPREPYWVGARWLGRASGRLIVAADGGHGISVENQLGRDLRSLALWHHGELYSCGALARGKRVQLLPYAGHKPWTAPAIPESPILTPARTLIYALQAGNVAAGRYVAEAEWTTASSSLIQDPLELISRPELLITGVY